VRILVTGGAGYIGSVTVRYLLDAGHEVAVLDSLEKGNAAALPEDVELGIGDVGDAELLDRLLPGTDVVVHCAGLIEVAESQLDPGRYFEANVARPLGMLRAMARHGVDSIVFSSTAAVYGEPDVVPLVESSMTVPVNAYGESKLMFERMLGWFGAAHGIGSVALRYFNVAGAWPDGSIGEAHDPETHLIPRVLRALQGGRRVFEVYGDDYPTPDGTCIRDYVHVLDLARAHGLAAAWLAEGGESRAFNLGSGRGYSNLEIVRACSDAAGAEVDVTFGPRRPGDPAVLVASYDAAEEALGWRPDHGKLREMVGDAWRWHSHHPQGYACPTEPSARKEDGS
jgi:UDP-glucose 4-epimerase